MGLFGSDPTEEAAIELYRAVVGRARAPVFYAAFEVPDTLDGRFEMIALHGFLLLDRLQRDNAAPLAQALVETLFSDMDRNLREIGVGDLSVGTKVRAMAEAFYGRAVAYRDSIGDPLALAGALTRNVWGTTAPPRPASRDALAFYMVDSRAHLAAQPIAPIARGAVDFGRLPAP